MSRGHTNNQKPVRVLSDGDEICRNAEEIVLITRPRRSAKRALTRFISAWKVKGLHHSNKVTLVLTISLFSRGVGTRLFSQPSHYPASALLLLSCSQINTRANWRASSTSRPSKRFTTIIYVVPQRYDPRIKRKALVYRKKQSLALSFSSVLPPHRFIWSFVVAYFFVFLSLICCNSAVNFPHPTVSHSLTQKGFFNLNLTNVCIASAHHPACALLSFALMDALQTKTNLSLFVLFSSLLTSL